MRLYPDLAMAILGVANSLRYTGKSVESLTWHKQRTTWPMFEALGVDLKAPMPEDQDQLKALVRPNLPWADTHFEERVSGIAYNPPPSHEIWPFRVASNSAHIDEGKFSHTYPERFWPRAVPGAPTMGLRFELGDLNDLINLLDTDHTTRQAYLPIFFPEDTGSKLNQRVPCTLGYHLIIRDGYLHITYYMRSCDFLRHFQDDLYLAVRLAQYVRDRLAKSLKMGYIRMDIVSLHIFENEKVVLENWIRRWNPQM